MTALWVIYLVAVPAVVGAGLIALERGARAAGLATRLLWLGGLALALGWPVAAMVAGSVPSVGALVPVVLPPTIITIGQAADDALARGAGFDDGVLRDVALALWAGAAAFALLRLAAGAMLLRRERATWTRERLDDTDVLVSEGRGPAVVGILAPRIVVPRWIHAIAPADRALVLRHEGEHVRARDPLPYVMGLVLVALAPWNPALRWLFGRLALAIETDCDARVLRAGTSRQRYEHLLATMAGRSTSTRLAPALAERASHLERRILAMRQQHTRRSPFLSIASVAVGAALIAVACTTPTPADVDTSSGAASTRAAEAATSAATDKPFFEFQVDSQVMPRHMSAPVYPAELRRQGVEGEVIAQFVVDGGGRVEMDTFKAVKSTGPGFTDAVRTALATAEFTPAKVGDRTVKQLVQMPFVFSLNR